METFKRTRFDIQVLRGVAVLLVVLYHGFAGLVPNGFLGVDVFFVISGYLITSMILRDLDRGTFTFVGFYLRRAKRLLPAAYCTFIVTSLLAYAFLTSVEWIAFLKQLFGAVTFTANMVLARQVGYFDVAAATKPLIHIWSLSLEEQFYFIIPLLLWGVARQRRMPVLLLCFVASLALCLVGTSIPQYQSWAFYSLPTRAWELLIGSLCAGHLLRKRPVPPAPLQWAALLIILAVSVYGIDPVHPRFDAILVSLATAVIMLGGDGWLPRSLLTRPVAVIGDWSYSLYLVHWPLFCFAYLAFAGRPPLDVAMAMVGLSLVLAWAQYRFVETYFREAWRVADWKAIASFAVVPVALALIVAPAALASRKARAIEYVLRANYGLSEACDQRGGRWSNLAECRTGDRPEIAVWGDSLVMHWVPGLLAHTNKPIVQLTKSACGPTPGVAQINALFPPTWARECVNFNHSALRAILTSRSIKYVLISSPFSQTLVDNGEPLLVDGQQVAWSPVAARRLEAVLVELKAAGKIPLLIAPVPRAAFDPAACNLRQLEGVRTLRRTSCNFPIGDVQEEYAKTLTLLKIIAANSGVRLFIPQDAICASGSCVTRVGPNLIYRDRQHLTEWGSRRLVSSMGLDRAFE